MYQIDHTLSTQQNLVKLANTRAAFPFVEDDFTFGNRAAITPSDANEQSNTDCALIASVGGRFVGVSDIFYTRLTIPTNRPTAGVKISCTNADTHESIHLKICERHQLVREEIAFTDPSRLAVGGETLNYTMNPITGSALYAPGSLTIAVTNQSPFKNADPSYFYGSPVGTFNSRPVYLLPATAYTTYSSRLVSKRQAFINLMNLKRLKTNAAFKLSDLTLDVPVPGTIDGANGNTLIQFDPADADSLITAGGYFLYTRVVAAESTSISSGQPGYDAYTPLANEQLYGQWQTQNGYPSDEFSFIRVISTVANRSVVFQQLTPTFVVVPNPDQYNFDINN